MLELCRKKHLNFESHNSVSSMYCVKVFENTGVFGGTDRLKSPLKVLRLEMRCFLAEIGRTVSYRHALYLGKVNGTLIPVNIFLCSKPADLVNQLTRTTNQRLHKLQSISKGSMRVGSHR